MKSRKIMLIGILLVLAAFFTACSNNSTPSKGYWYMTGDDVPTFYIDGAQTFTLYDTYGNEGIVGKYDIKDGKMTFYFSDGYEMFSFNVKDSNNLVVTSEIGSGAAYTRRDDAVFMSPPPYKEMLSGVYYLDGKENGSFLEFFDDGEVYSYDVDTGDTYDGFYDWDGEKATMSFYVDEDSYEEIVLIKINEITLQVEGQDEVFILINK